MMEMDILFEFLRSDGSIVINKRLAAAIGLQEAIVYSELVSKYKYFSSENELTEDGFFFNTVENLQSDCFLGEKSQMAAIKKLVKLNLIFKSVRGLPARRYFKINEDASVLLKILSSVPKKGKKNPQTQENQENLHSGGTRTSRMEEQETTKGGSNNNKTNKTKLINKTTTIPVVVPSPSTLETNAKNELIADMEAAGIQPATTRKYLRQKGFDAVKTQFENLKKAIIEGNKPGNRPVDSSGKWLRAAINEGFNAETEAQTAKATTSQKGDEFTAQELAELETVAAADDEHYIKNEMNSVWAKKLEELTAISMPSSKMKME